MVAPGQMLNLMLNPILSLTKALAQSGLKTRFLGFGLGFEHFAAPVKTGRADVVAQMRFARRGLHGNAGNRQSGVRVVHSALGRRFFILLDGHNEAPKRKGLQKGLAELGSAWIRAPRLCRIKPSIIARGQV